MRKTLDYDSVLLLCLAANGPAAFLASTSPNPAAGGTGFFKYSVVIGGTWTVFGLQVGKIGACGGTVA